jgi:hypothetical protein
MGSRPCQVCSKYKLVILRGAGLWAEEPMKHIEIPALDPE